MKIAPKDLAIALTIVAIIGVIGVTLALTCLASSPQPAVVITQHQCRAKFPSACGPCSCVSALSYFGIQASQFDLIKLCGTTINGGTPPKALVAAMATMGASCTAASASEAVSAGTVCVAAYTESKGVGHWVCTYGDGSGCVVNDSALDAPRYVSATDVSMCDYVYRVQLMDRTSP